MIKNEDVFFLNNKLLIQTFYYTYAYIKLINFLYFNLHFYKFKFIILDQLF
jgi:hypothetical protein